MEDPGEDLPPLLPQHYVSDILDVCHVEAAELEEWQAELDRLSRRYH